MTTDPFKQATAAAIEDIHAALGGTDQADVVSDSAEPAPQPEPDRAAAEAPGHGAIRLRGRIAASQPVVAGHVGHGTIRLHDPTASPDGVARLRRGERSRSRDHPPARPRGAPEPGLLHAIAEPIEPQDRVTEAAREDILAAIASTS